MGLDIYLYERAHHEQNERHDVEWNALYERKASGEIAEAEYDAQREQITQYAPHVDAPSGQYPDHLFNRRYLRSSYNDSGFNHAVPDFLATSAEAEYPGARGSLYWIFEPMGREWDGDEGTLTADDVDKLRACKARALEVADELRKADPLRVAEEGNVFIAPTMRADQFLAWYREQKATRSEAYPEGGYSTGRGTVFGFAKGMEVLAVTLGIGTLGNPAALIVYRSEAIDSYIQSAEITAEFCDEAISLIERDGSCHLSWSG